VYRILQKSTTLRQVPTQKMSILKATTAIFYKIADATGIDDARVLSLRYIDMAILKKTLSADMLDIICSKTSFLAGKSDCQSVFKNKNSNLKKPFVVVRIIIEHNRKKRWPKKYGAHKALTKKAELMLYDG
jgi:hypothetical protein